MSEKTGWTIAVLVIAALVFVNEGRKRRAVAQEAPATVGTPDGGAITIIGGSSGAGTWKPERPGSITLCVENGSVAACTSCTAPAALTSVTTPRNARRMPPRARRMRLSTSAIMMLGLPGQ